MKLIFTLIVAFVPFLGTTQKLKTYRVDHMRMGEIYAASLIQDTMAPGGFGQSKNFPHSNADLLSFNQPGVYLHIDEDTQATYRKEYPGYELYLVNNSDSTLALAASDSRIEVIAEAFVDKQWQAIEYLPRSWCGNSYHSVVLEDNSYWKFTIPQFKGRLKTKIRYRLLITRDANPQAALASPGYIYSNEIDASINRSQLTQKL